MLWSHLLIKLWKIYQAASNSILPRGVPRGTLQSPSLKIWRKVFCPQYPDIVFRQAFSIAFFSWWFVTYLFLRILKKLNYLKVNNFHYECIVTNLFRDTVSPFGQNHLSSLKLEHCNPAARDMKTVITEFLNLLLTWNQLIPPLYKNIFTFCDLFNPGLIYIRIFIWETFSGNGWSILRTKFLLIYRLDKYFKTFKV